MTINEHDGFQERVQNIYLHPPFNHLSVCRLHLRQSLSIFNSLLATRCREEEIGKEDGIFKKGGQSKAIMEAETRDDW